MAKDKLFLLKPGFPDNGEGPFYCPGCAEVEGLLGYHHLLRQQLEITYVDFPRPRPAIVELIGEANQSAPVLVLAEKPGELPPGVPVQEYQGRYFVAEAKEIGYYLAHKYGTARSHA